MRTDFAVFILSNGRPSNIKTMESLKKGNYTGKTYIIIDDEDETASEYYKNYGDQVVMFNKKEAALITDTGDNKENKNVVVFARNKTFEIAKELGLEYFLVLDDDYSTFHHRLIEDNKFKQKESNDLDKLFNSFIKFLDVSGAATVTMAQGGDFIGGKDNGQFQKGYSRKAMNTFFCKTDRPFKFYGRINEDTTAYCLLGSQGKLFFTIMKASINQGTTQKNKGGLTEEYLDVGTYVKSFYTVMYMPSSVKVSQMGGTHRRMHHKVSWNNTVPKIISSRYKKGRN